MPKKAKKSKQGKNKGKAEFPPELTIRQIVNRLRAEAKRRVDWLERMKGLLPCDDLRDAILDPDGIVQQNLGWGKPPCYECEEKPEKDCNKCLLKEVDDMWEKLEAKVEGGE